MNEPLVSVIVPTIGRPVFFQKALASVAAQTYPNLEIFVSDNAAEPAITEEEVRAACGGRSFRLVRRETRLSFAEHFNTCLREASGHYAMFLSDDDLLVPRFVETAVACIESDPQIGAVMSKQTRIDETFLEAPPDPALSWEAGEANRLYQLWWEGDGNPDILTFVSVFGRRAEMLSVGGFGDYPSGAHSDIQLLLGTTLGRRLGYVSGGILYRVYPTSVGLGMPWAHLWNGTVAFEERVAEWVAEGRADRRLQRALVRNHSSSMLARYRKLYRKRKGWANKGAPLVGIGIRIAANLVKHGAGATPVLHRLFKMGDRA